MNNNGKLYNIFFFSFTSEYYKYTEGDVALKLMAQNPFLRVNQKFSHISVTWGRIQSSPRRDHEGDQPQWTVRCQTCLILFKCYSSLWIRSQPQNPQFYALPDHGGSCNPSKISSTIWLLYWDHLHLSSQLKL